jgi:hypothetical protein
MPSLDTGPSRQVLEDTPGRALAFLSALSSSLPIRSILDAHGYGEAEHHLGWLLLLQASGYRRALPATQNDPVVRAAALELDATDEPLFARAGAVLGRFAPEQNAFVFEDLEAATGPGAIVSIATFLDRLDALESGPDRAATREDDKSALARLAERGIDSAERARLRALVKTATRSPVAAPPPAPSSASAPLELTLPGATAPAEPPAPAVDQAETLRKLRAWYDDWSRTAKAVIKRRDHLIALGLAKRSKKRKATGTDAPAAPATPPNSPV